MSNEIRNQVSAGEDAHVEAELEAMWSEHEQARAEEERRANEEIAQYLFGEESEEEFEDEEPKNRKLAGSNRRNNDDRAKRRNERTVDAAVNNLRKRKADAKSAGAKMAGKPDKKIQKAKKFDEKRKKLIERGAKKKSAIVPEFN